MPDGGDSGFGDDDDDQLELSKFWRIE